MSKNCKAEFNSPARSAASDDVAVYDNSFLDILCTFCSKSILESVIACHLSAFKIRKQTKYNAWSGAYCGKCTSFSVMLLHDVHEFSECCKI